MRHLLSGVALAALIAATGPAWAQALANPPLPAAQQRAASAQTGTATATTNATTRHHRVHMRQAHYAWHGPRYGWHHSHWRPYAWRDYGWRGGYGGGWSDRVADRLNAEELGRVAGPGAGYGMVPPPGY